MSNQRAGVLEIDGRNPIESVVKQDLSSVTQARIVSAKKSILEHISTPFEFVGPDTMSYYKLKMEVSLNNSTVETVKCTLSIFLEEENILLSDCGNRNVKFANNISFSFMEAGLSIVEKRRIIE